MSGSQDISRIIYFYKKWFYWLTNKGVTCKSAVHSWLALTPTQRCVQTFGHSLNRGQGGPGIILYTLILIKSVLYFYQFTSLKRDVN